MTNDAWPQVYQHPLAPAAALLTLAALYTLGSGIGWGLGSILARRAARCIVKEKR